MPSLAEVIAAIRGRLFEDLARADAERLRAISGRLISRYATALMQLETGDASAEVQAAARAGLLDLASRLERQRGMADFTRWMANRIDQHLERPAPPGNPVKPGPGIPPGSPIGSTSSPGTLDWVAEQCWHCGD